MHSAKYRPLLSSERAPYVKNEEIVENKRNKCGRELQWGVRHEDID
jgi:hypothetical protein